MTQRPQLLRGSDWMTLTGTGADLELDDDAPDDHALDVLCGSNSVRMHTHTHRMGLPSKAAVPAGATSQKGLALLLGQRSSRQLCAQIPYLSSKLIGASPERLTGLA
eukprot:1159569-Pelagomonas_calceolata.AAC.8